jgi:hypothetical protein
MHRTLKREAIRPPRATTVGTFRFKTKRDERNYIIRE